ncbi:hypothetical protein QCA50_002219 [Cerrena zonata]|uniref:Enoyl reductase (ER) domain-containing protein n=1 Tax=Cerrena zonata TaxID=2478898 RepID=A0AAW0GNI1_9APHY
MFAFRLNTTTIEITREEIPIPVPKEDEVLVKVTAAGVCGSDVSAVYHPERVQLRALTGGDSLTMGHEAAGVVTELGSGVAANYPELVVGTHVAMLGTNPCNEDSCDACLVDRGNLCWSKGWYGLTRDGAWAAYVAIRASSAVPVPTKVTIPPGVVAVATDAVLTPYHAVKTIANVRAGENVLIIGSGGLGLNAVQIAKNCTEAACVIATDLREQSLGLAKEIGADHAVLPDKLAELISTHKLRVDVVVDFVGIPSTIKTAVTVVKRLGRVVIAGIGANVFEIPRQTAMAKEVQILPSMWGTRSELVEVLGAIGEGKITPKVETRPFDECIKVLEELRDGKLKSRVALIP